MADKLLPLQYILSRCFNEVDGSLAARHGLLDSQNYFNAVFDSDRDALRVFVDGLPALVQSLDGEDAANVPSSKAVVDYVVEYVRGLLPSAALTLLEGTNVELAPFGRYEWVVDGDCSLSASDGWPAAGHASSFVVIDFATDSTLSLVGIDAGDNDALDDPGIYECYVKCYNGSFGFRVVDFVEAEEVEEEEP